jgi:hypothetical protein
LNVTREQQARENNAPPLFLREASRWAGLKSLKEAQGDKDSKEGRGQDKAL